MSALATNSDKPHPIGGRRGAWPGFKTRAWPQCRWAAARPGWASPSDTSAAGVEGAGGTCRGAGGRRRGLAGLRDDARATHQQPGADGVEGAGETCRGAGGRRQGLAGLRADTPISNPAPLVWRAPEGPEGTGGLRGAAPNEVRPPSLAGGRALRRPEHPWGRKQRRNTRGTASTAERRSLRTPRSTPGSGRPGGRRVARAR